MKMKDRYNAFLERHPRLTNFTKEYRGEIMTVAAVAVTVVVVTHLPKIERCTFILSLKGN
jgi:hypothetical protein